MTTSDDKLIRILDNLVKKVNTTSAGGKTSNRNALGTDDFVGIFDTTRSVELQTIITDGLLFYLPFDSRAAISATAWREAVDTGENYSTDDTQNLSELLIAGKVGDGFIIYQPTATGNYIECPAPAGSTTILGGLSSFSIDFWLYVNFWSEFTNYGFMQLIATDGVTLHSGVVGLTQSGNVYSAIDTATGTPGGFSFSTAAPVTQDTWLHVCCTYDSVSGGTIYINAEVDGTGGGGEGAFYPLSTSGYSQILFLPSPEVIYIDDFKIYNRALAQGEVLVNSRALQPPLLGDAVLGEFIVL